MKKALLLGICIAATCLFAGLSVWQLERRSEKLALIERVETRIHARPVQLLPRNRWQTVTAETQEYRRVRVDGIFQHDRATYVDALTVQGPGVWLMTPLIAQEGVILVNRGFLPRSGMHSYSRPTGRVSVTGLIRMSEPDGRILRPNQPSNDIWYSRDVAAISLSRGLRKVAPFFIDADAEPRTLFPAGGMTMVQFRNHHLIYALTWLALACLAALGAFLGANPGRYFSAPAKVSLKPDVSWKTTR